MGFPGLCKILFEQCIFLFTDVCEFSVWKFINVNIHSVSKKKKKKSGTKSKYTHKANISTSTHRPFFFFLAKRINSCNVWYCFSISSTVGNFAEQSTLCELSPSACERSHMSIAVLLEAGGAQGSEISVRASFCRASRDDALCRRGDPSTPTRVWFTFGAAPKVSFIHSVLLSGKSPPPARPLVFSRLRGRNLLCGGLFPSSLPVFFFMTEETFYCM